MQATCLRYRRHIMQFSFSHEDGTFYSADDIKTLAQAREYLRSRMKDAVACYFEVRSFASPIELARHLMRFW